MRRKKNWDKYKIRLTAGKECVKCMNPYWKLQI